MGSGRKGWDEMGSGDRLMPPQRCYVKWASGELKAGLLWKIWVGWS